MSSINKVLFAKKLEYMFQLPFGINALLYKANLNPYLAEIKQGILRNGIIFPNTQQICTFLNSEGEICEEIDVQRYLIEEVRECPNDSLPCLILVAMHVLIRATDHPFTFILSLDNIGLNLEGMTLVLQAYNDVLWKATNGEHIVSIEDEGAAINKFFVSINDVFEKDVSEARINEEKIISDLFKTYMIQVFSGRNYYYRTDMCSVRRYTDDYGNYFCKHENRMMYAKTVSNIEYRITNPPKKVKMNFPANVFGKRTYSTFAEGIFIEDITDRYNKKYVKSKFTGQVCCYDNRNREYYYNLSGMLFYLRYDLENVACGSDKKLHKFYYRGDTEIFTEYRNSFDTFTICDDKEFVSFDMVLRYLVSLHAIKTDVYQISPTGIKYQVQYSDIDVIFYDSDDILIPFNRIFSSLITMTHLHRVRDWFFPPEHRDETVFEIIRLEPPSQPLVNAAVERPPIPNIYENIQTTYKTQTLTKAEKEDYDRQLPLEKAIQKQQNTAVLANAPPVAQTIAAVLADVPHVVHRRRFPQKDAFVSTRVESQDETMKRSTSEDKLEKLITESSQNIPKRNLSVGVFPYHHDEKSTSIKTKEEKPVKFSLDEDEEILHYDQMDSDENAEILYEDEDS
jgi:hypothetical protein